MIFMSLVVLVSTRGCNANLIKSEVDKLDIIRKESRDSFVANGYYLGEKKVEKVLWSKGVAFSRIYSTISDMENAGKNLLWKLYKTWPRESQCEGAAGEVLQNCLERINALKGSHEEAFRRVYDFFQLLGNLCIEPL